MTTTQLDMVAAAASEQEMRFEFGRNWHQFIQRNLSQQVVEDSKRHMLEFLGLTTLAGKSFLDIGCGSGLHSLAAHQAGARDITGFDYDQHSVDATLVARKFAGNPPGWRVTRGSVLDETFVETLPRTDIVYSWGVLHHTGDVWRAIRNAAGRVPPGGQFYIALYSADVQKDPPPEFWLDVKRRYNAASPFGKQRMVAWYVWRFAMARNPLRLPIVLKHMLDRRRLRGMRYLTDIRDWLGGWPMEFVYDRDAIAFCEKLGLTLERIKTGEANTEFLFRRPNGA